MEEERKREICGFEDIELMHNLGLCVLLLYV